MAIDEQEIQSTIELMKAQLGEAGVKPQEPAIPVRSVTGQAMPYPDAARDLVKRSLFQQMGDKWKRTAKEDWQGGWDDIYAALTDPFSPMEQAAGPGGMAPRALQGLGGAFQAAWAPVRASIYAPTEQFVETPPRAVGERVGFEGRKNIATGLQAVGEVAPFARGMSRLGLKAARNIRGRGKARIPDAILPPERPTARPGQPPTIEAEYMVKPPPRTALPPPGTWPREGEFVKPHRGPRIPKGPVTDPYSMEGGAREIESLDRAVERMKGGGSRRAIDPLAEIEALLNVFRPKVPQATGQAQTEQAFAAAFPRLPKAMQQTMTRSPRSLKTEILYDPEYPAAYSNVRPTGERVLALGHQDVSRGVPPSAREVMAEHELMHEAARTRYGTGPSPAGLGIEKALPKDAPLRGLLETQYLPKDIPEELAGMFPYTRLEPRTLPRAAQKMTTATRSSVFKALQDPKVREAALAELAQYHKTGDPIQWAQRARQKVKGTSRGLEQQ